MVVVVVLAIIAGISVLGYNAQIKAAHDSKSSVNLLSLADALDKYYSTNGNYPVTCGHSGHAVLDCDNVDDTYAGMTASPKITSGMTTSQLQAILPDLDDKFTHPSNPDESPLNRTVANIIQADSYFLLSMDMVPGANSGDDGGGGGIITPPPSDCGRGDIFCTGPIDTNSNNVQLANYDQQVLGEATAVTDSSVAFADPSGSGSFQCNFQLTGKNPNGTEDVRPHQYVLGYVNEESSSWNFFIQGRRADLNVVNWNSASNSKCQAETIGALK